MSINLEENIYYLYKPLRMLITMDKTHRDLVLRDNIDEFSELLSHIQMKVIKEDLMGKSFELVKDDESEKEIYYSIIMKDIFPQMVYSFNGKEKYELFTFDVFNMNSFSKDDKEQNCATKIFLNNFSNSLGHRMFNKALNEFFEYILNSDSNDDLETLSFDMGRFSLNFSEFINADSEKDKDYILRRMLHGLNYFIFSMFQNLTSHFNIEFFITPVSILRIHESSVRDLDKSEEYYNVVNIEDILTTKEIDNVLLKRLTDKKEIKNALVENKFK